MSIQYLPTMDLFTVTCTTTVDQVLSFLLLWTPSMNGYNVNNLANGQSKTYKEAAFHILIAILKGVAWNAIDPQTPSPFLQARGL